MDSDAFETLLDAKINPLIDTIKRLELSQEKMVDLMMTQARMNESLLHLQKEIDANLGVNMGVHNELFGRLREIEKNTGCKEVQKELSVVQKELAEEIKGIKDSHQDKLWDVIKLVLSGVSGGLVIWLFKK